jgi:hypothetical protein
MELSLYLYTGSKRLLLYKHSRRKKRSVREAITNGKWIADIAHLNHSFARWVPQTMEHDWFGQFNFLGWRAWLHFLEPWELRLLVLYKISLHYTIFWAHTILFPISDLGSLSPSQVQVLPLVTPTRQAMDCSKTTMAWLGEQLHLCPKLQEPGDCSTPFFFRMPLCQNCVGLSSWLVLL